MITLKEQEQIIAVVRRYGLTFFWNFFFGFFMLVASFFFMFWLFAHDWWGQTLFGLGIFIGLFIFIKTLFLWKKNRLILTTTRVVDWVQRGFFEQEITEIYYSDMGSVWGKVKGIGGTIFRYGEIVLENSSGTMQIIFEKVKRPVFWQQKISSLKEDYMV